MPFVNKLRVMKDGRQCSRCKAFKPWAEFARNKHGTRGHQSWCRDCFREHTGSQKNREYLINEVGRECSECGQFKPWSEFHKRNNLTTGHAAHCKICRRRRTRRDMENGSIRNRELKRKYGIDLETYQIYCNEQGDSCAICGTMEKGTARGRARYWSVDHDHETGEVRGLLCQKCNGLLGLVNDDIRVLERAILYLKSYGK